MFYSSVTKRNFQSNSRQFIFFLIDHKCHRTAPLVTYNQNVALYNLTINVNTSVFKLQKKNYGNLWILTAKVNTKTFYYGQIDVGTQYFWMHIWNVKKIYFSRSVHNPLLLNFHNYKCLYYLLTYLLKNILSKTKAIILLLLWVLSDMPP